MGDISRNLHESIEFDYTNQAWVVDGRYERCGHSTCIIDAHAILPFGAVSRELYLNQLAQSCYGTRHVGERPHPDASVH